MSETTFDLAPARGDVAGAQLFVPTKHRVRLSEAWTTAPVARMLAARDMKVRYKQSVLGPLWLVLQPLGMLLAVTIAFYGVTKVDTGDVPYVLFALVGLCVWTYFQLTMMAATMAVVANTQLVRRSPCPRLALMNATVISHLAPLAVVLSITLVGLILNRGLPLQALLLPVLLAWLVLFVWGVTLLIGSFAARFRDAIALVPLMIQAGIFVSPVGYPLENIPENISLVLAVNPISGLIEAWRWCLLGSDPLVHVILISLAWTAALLVIGWNIFARMEVRFADYV